MDRGRQAGPEQDAWDMTRPIEGEAKVEGQGRPRKEGGKGKERRFGQGRRFAAPGEYRVDIDVEARTAT